MTTLREAAQQALEAMELIDKEFKKHGRQHWFEAVKARAAITALRAALAEPVQEPVAWMNTEDGFCTLDSPVEGIDVMSQWVPLYAAPPQRKPLTEEEIKECERQAMVNGSLPFEQRVFFARAIERAHGIT